MILPIRRYAVFAGRSRRREFWMFFLLQVGLFILASFIDVALGYGEVNSYAEGYSAGFSLDAHGPAIISLALGLLIPNFAVAVRRLHDTNRSGWWLLLLLVPLFGWLALLIFYCLDGQSGPNRFGEDPKGRAPTAYL